MYLTSSPQLYTSPQQIALVPGASAQFTIVSPQANLGSAPTFTPSITGQVSFAKVSGDNTVQLWTATASADAYATTAVAITDAAGETGFLNIAITQAVTGVPTGYTSLALIAQIRLRAVEPNLPVNSDILTLANAGVETIVNRLGGIKLVGTFPTLPNQTIQALTSDVQDIISCSWSTGPVTAQGSLVYPMFPLPEGQFMDAAAGFPAVGFGPPTYYFIYQDAAGTMQMQLYPAAMQGQINVYYRARPILWTLSGSSNGVASNLDSSMQEAVVLWTTGMVLCARSRSDEAKDVWFPLFDQKMEELDTLAKRRTNPKTGQVRDVMGRTYPGPWGWL
jgi:hypothetical protein